MELSATLSLYCEVCSDSAEACWRQNRRAHPMVTGRSGG